MVIEVVDTEVVSANNIEIEIPNEAIIVSEDNKDYDVRIVKKEYTIIGDGIFIPSMYENAPPWLKEFINTTIEVAVINRDQSLVDRMQAILTLMDYVPKNQYTEQINQIVSPDGIINSRIATLNSNLVDAINNINATIAEINLTYVTKKEASAIAYNVLTASMSDTGEIGSSLITMREAYTNLREAVSSEFSLMQTTFGDYVEGATQELNSVRAYAEGVESKFAYNSTLKVNGAVYESGFGLANSLTTGSGIPVGDSEFWIKADKFRLVSSSGIKSSYSPFSVDATTRDINFNGKVSFENMADDFDPAAIINTKTTTIDGGKITTNSIAASKISSYNLTSSNATIGNAIIKSANIGDLEVGTIKIANGAINDVYVAKYPGTFFRVANTAQWGYPVSVTVTIPANASVLISANALFSAGSNNDTIGVAIWDTTTMEVIWGFSGRGDSDLRLSSNSYIPFNCTTNHKPGNTSTITKTYSLGVKGFVGSSGAIAARQILITAMVHKR